MGSEEQDGDEPGALREVLFTVVFALGLAWLVQGYLVKPFQIPSGSMENTLRCGDRVLVNRFGNFFGDPERGDVVVFHPPAATINGKVDPDITAGQDGERPKTPGKVVATAANPNYIKRIIGEPGDKVEVKRHHAYVNGKMLDEPYLHPLPEDGSLETLATMKEITVPKGTYLMLGDHRDASSDGRVFGYVPREHIIGKAFMVYWPPKRFGGLPEKDPGANAEPSNCGTDGQGQGEAPEGG